MAIPDTRLQRVRAVASMLDSAIKIPGTSVRIGLDPILGLIPGLGDISTAAMSGYIVLTAIKMGAPRHIVVRMIANVALDTVAGSVPLLGDLFDAGWKSNTRNVALLERYFTTDERTTTKGNRLHMVAGIVILALLAIGGFVLAYNIMMWVLHFFL